MTDENKQPASVDTAVNPLLERLRVMQEAVALRQAGRLAYEATPEGMAELARNAAVKLAREAVKRKAKLTEACDDARIPEELGLRTIALDDAAPQTDALVAMRDALRWRRANSTRDGVAPVIRLVSGPPGTGKSCALAWIAARHRGSAEWVTAATIAGTPRNGWSTNEEAWQRWINVDLLCVDELGAERGDPAVLPALFAERYNSGRATIVTANTSLADFHRRYKDERLADRIANGQQRGGAEGGLPWFVLVTGASLRNPANREAFAVASAALDNTRTADGADQADKIGIIFGPDHYVDEPRNSWDE